MLTKTLATLALLAGASDASFFSRSQDSANVYDSCLLEVERLCSHNNDEYTNTLTRMVETEPQIRQALDKDPILEDVMNNNQMELTEDAMESMMVSAIFFSDVVKNSENYYDEDTPEDIFDLMIVFVMDNTSDKEKLANDMSMYGLKVLESSDEEEEEESYGIRRKLASQLVEVKQFPEIRLRKVVQRKNGEPEIKTGFPSLKFGAARDVCLWRKFNNGSVKDSDCITALNTIGEEVNHKIKRDSPESVLMLPVRTKNVKDSVETTYLIFNRDTFNTMTYATMGLTVAALFAVLYYTLFDSSDDEEDEEDNDDATSILVATMILLPFSFLMWYEPLLSHFAFVPAMIVLGIHCCMDVSSRDETIDEDIETEMMLEKGFAYVAIPVQVV